MAATNASAATTHSSHKSSWHTWQVSMAQLHTERSHIGERMRTQGQVPSIAPGTSHESCEKAHGAVRWEVRWGCDGGRDGWPEVS